MENPEVDRHITFLHIQLTTNIDRISGALEEFLSSSLGVDRLAKFVKRNDNAVYAILKAISGVLNSCHSSQEICERLVRAGIALRSMD